MRMDFFVHPEVPKKDLSDINTELYSDYLDKLLEKAYDSDVPVGIKGIEQENNEIIEGYFSENAPEGMQWLNSTSYFGYHHNFHIT